MTSVDGELTGFGPEDAAILADDVAGPVLRPGEPGFAEETAAFQLALSHRPAVAVGATSAADVQAAVVFAETMGLAVAVLNTGHGAAVSADGAVLINTRRMTGVTIDAEEMTARVEAGVRWQQVVDAAAEMSLAPIAGSSPLVGVVGYHLGGGLSPVLGRPLGYAADHVRSLDVVTADGRLRHVTAEHEPELFWALRGGEGNFGVVTAIEFDLFPVTTFYGGGLYFEGEDAAAVLRAYQSFVQDLPDQLSSSVLLIRTPDLPEIPEPVRGKLVVHVRIAHLGSEEEGARLIAPLRAAAPVLIDYVGEMPFTAIASIHNDPTDPLPTYQRTAMLPDLAPAAVERLLELVGPRAADPVMAVEIRHLGGALARSPKIPNPVGNRDAAFSLFAVDLPGPNGVAATEAALDAVIEGMRPWTTGGRCLNFMGAADTAPESVRTAYTPQSYERLLAAKRRFDPENIFRINHNLA